MTTKSKSKMLDELKADLFSEREEVVLKALEKCQDYGDLTLIEPLIAVYGHSGNPEVKAIAAEMLETLKVSKTEAPFLSALKNAENKAIRKDILAFMWNSGCQPVDDIPFITSLAVEGNLEELLECVTLLDSIDASISEEGILESMNILRPAINTEKEVGKKKLLMEYQGILASMSEQD
jgi:hypothetical protein